MATVVLCSSFFFTSSIGNDEISLLSKIEDFIIDLTPGLSSVSLRTHLTLAKRDEAHLLRLPDPINPSTLSYFPIQDPRLGSLIPIYSHSISSIHLLLGFSVVKTLTTRLLFKVLSAPVLLSLEEVDSLFFSRERQVD